MPLEYLGQCVLPQKPAAVKWSSYDEGTFLVSSYELIKQDGQPQRDGCLYMIKNNRMAKQIPVCAGIFRFDIHPIEENCLVGALTNGYLCRIDLSNSNVNLVRVADKRMLMSVSLMRNEKVLTSDEYGYVHIVDLNSANEKCEVWDVCWLNENLLISGADDGLLKLWDIRTEQKPVAICEEHSCGVTCLQSERDGTYLLSGSYDEHIRRFDVRFLQESSSKANLGGGVWAIESTGNGRLLVSCMYNGWCLLESATFALLESNHAIGENLLYGASLDPTSSVIASTTFNNYTVNFEKLHISG